MRKYLPILTVAAFIPLLVLAADPVQIENPLGVDADFTSVMDKIIDFVFKIAVVLAPLMIVVGGAIFVTSGGNLQKTDQAKKIMIWTAVGLLVIIMAKGIIALIRQLLGA